MDRKIAFLLALPLLLGGCGGNSSKSSAAGSGPISGNWQMALQSSNTNRQTFPQSGFLLQSGDAVSGSVLLVDSPCSGIGSVSGTVSGSAVSLVVSPTGIEVDLTGTLGSDQASMSGTYTILSLGCAGRQTAPQSGTWTANLVPPLNGNIQGTFAQTYLGLNFALAGQVTQGANTGISNAPLAGTMTSVGYCFTTANIVGVISGTSVVMNLVNPDGTQVGEVTGTTTLDGTSLTGIYRLEAQPNSTTPSCRGGESGTVTMTL